MQSVNRRKHATELLSQLNAGQLAAVIHLLEVMIGPTARAIVAAPPDDEPVTQEDRQRFHNGQKWFAQHGDKGISMQEVLADFGLKPEDFPLS